MKFCRIYMLMLLVVVLTTEEVVSQSSVKVMSYNVENLFDTKDDSLYNDREYLYGGLRGWSEQRYRQKLQNIAKVIVAAGQWQPPALVGLCEIENANVLFNLTRNTGLLNIGYKFIHYESPDARGVDVALLYIPHIFEPINSRAIRVALPNTHNTTRDILYACGTLQNRDTVHIFVNHFPSRLGGELESEERRVAAASFLRNAVDSVFNTCKEANIIIMGDFNDYPDNYSITTTLGAIQPPKDSNEVEANQLYNLTYDIHKKGEIGSYRHSEQWGMLDQIIVSGRMLNKNNKTTIDQNTTRVFAAQWLLENDKIVGLRPFRTYVGMKFNNGFSDHLPVLVDINLKK